ncbi:MAG TPA: DUF2844 domain-containing protein [Candidatus Cybelea sp.]|nr:DUF2844 domain-containing protein [Candidatus Cybelea sp.]
MKSRIICFLFAVLALPFPLLASLGGDVTSVEADRVKMQGTLRTTSADSYTMHEIQTSTGVAVKEYVSPTGKVFAVTWRGPFHPDLRQLLGAYFGQYAQAVQDQRAQRHGHGPLLIQQPGLVVQITGHMRSLWGKAYVPQLLPAGIHAEDLQ